MLDRRSERNGEGDGVAVLLALASALVYGSADFCGGLATRRAAAQAVVAASQATGLVLLLVLLPWLGGAATTADFAWAAAAGAAGTLGLVLFYRALADGVMSVVAPVTALCAAAVPVLVGIALGDRLGVLAAVGIALALVAVVLVSADEGLSSLRRVRSAGLGMPLAAGVGFGLFFALLSRTSPDSGLTPLVALRGTAVVLLVLIALARRSSLRVPRAALPPVLLGGTLDITANALYLVATQLPGQLAVIGVLASLYPVSTVVLAQVVLRERLVRAQVAGLGTAALAVALITVPA
jgi:drug/metabolite transporter (DMT)-like permease